MIKAVVFDLDDTLYEYEKLNEQAIHAVCQKYADILKISEESFREAFEWGKNKTKEMMHDCASRHNRMLYFQKVSEYLKLNPIEYTLSMYETYWNYMLEHMTLYPGVLELFDYLKREHIKIGICTDLTVHIQHRKLQKLGIGSYIDVLVTSEEADAEKPDLRMFHLVLKKLNLNPEEVIYVGDSFEKDIVGAGNAGMMPIWFCVKGKQRDCDGNYTVAESFEKIKKGIL